MTTRLAASPLRIPSGLNSAPFTALGAYKKQPICMRFRTSHFPKNGVTQELKTKLRLLTSFQSVVASGDFRPHHSRSFRSLSTDTRLSSPYVPRNTSSRQPTEYFSRAASALKVHRREHSAYRGKPPSEFEGLLSIQPASVGVHRKGRMRRPRTVVVLCTETPFMCSKPEFRDISLNTNVSQEP